MKENNCKHEQIKLGDGIISVAGFFVTALCYALTSKEVSSICILTTLLIWLGIEYIPSMIIRVTHRFV